MNISIFGVADRLNVEVLGLAARIAVAVCVAVVVYLWARRPDHPGGRAAIGALLMFGVFLAGSLTESASCWSRRPVCSPLWRCRIGCLLSWLRCRGFCCSAVPAYHLGLGFDSLAEEEQIRYLVIELLLAAAAAWLALSPPPADPRPIAARVHVPAASRRACS